MGVKEITRLSSFFRMNPLCNHYDLDYKFAGDRRSQEIAALLNE